MTRRDHPFTDGDLIDYHLGELPPDRSESFEDHLFECSACAARLDEVGRIATAVRSAAADGQVGANVTGAYLERAAANGLSLREYRLEQGQTVACSGGPEDLFVVRLAADFSGAEDLSAEIDFRDLSSGESLTLPPRQVLPDTERGEIVLVFPGGEVRAYPRSVWTITVNGEVGGAARSYGPFVMDHTP
jgi:hypothetical protein